MSASLISKAETDTTHNNHHCNNATDSSQPGSKSTATTSGDEGALVEGSAAADNGIRNAKKRSASSCVFDSKDHSPHKILATSNVASEAAHTTLPKPPLPVLDSDLKQEAQEADPNGPMFGRPEKGKLRFFAICNDGSMQNMVWLLQLKQIFSRQLPKMPAQYITRLIFDPYHISLCLFKDLEPIGGISYRPFYEQEYAEIAFCAVTARQQIKGFGTLLMNHLKEHVKPTGLRFFLTYADNFATEYFCKQGFSKKLTLRKKLWQGLIKHYDGANLMECAINHKIDYTSIPRMLRFQRNLLYTTIRDHTESAAVYNGLTDFSEESSVFRRDAYNIPGVKEAGWRRPVEEPGGDGSSTKAGKKQSKQHPKKAHVDLQTSLTSIYAELKQTKFVWPFLKAVDPEEYPQYYEEIETPIDLAIIGQRVRNRQYNRKELFLADIVLMCENCRKFNQEDGNDYVKCANRVEKFVTPRVNALAVNSASS